jgi:hypothetical protein
MSTNAFIYFKEYKDEQSLTYPSKIAHTHSVEKITAAVKNTTDFGWIQSSGYSLHHQEIVNGTAWSVTSISIPWWRKQRNRSLLEASRNRATGGR